MKLGNTFQEREVREAIFEIKELFRFSNNVFFLVNTDETEEDKQAIEIRLQKLNGATDYNIINCHKPNLELCEQDTSLEKMKILERALNGHLEEGYDVLGIREILILHNLLKNSKLILKP